MYSPTSGGSENNSEGRLSNSDINQGNTPEYQNFHQRDNIASSEISQQDAPSGHHTNETTVPGLMSVPDPFGGTVPSGNGGSENTFDQVLIGNMLYDESMSRHENPHQSDNTEYSGFLQNVASSVHDMDQNTAVASENYLLIATQNIPGCTSPQEHALTENGPLSLIPHTEMPCMIAGGLGITSGQGFVNSHTHQGNSKSTGRLSYVDLLFSNNAEVDNDEEFDNIPHEDFDVCFEHSKDQPHPTYPNAVDKDLAALVTQETRKRGGTGRKKQKIGDKKNLYSAFTQHRQSLVRKLKKLQADFNAELVMIVFSPAGKLFTYGHPSENFVLEKYGNGNNDGLAEKPPKRSTADRCDTVIRKADDLCILCGIQAAVIIFLPSGALFAFGKPSVNEVVEKYKMLQANKDKERMEAENAFGKSQPNNTGFQEKNQVKFNMTDVLGKTELEEMNCLQKDLVKKVEDRPCNEFSNVKCTGVQNISEDIDHNHEPDKKPD